MVEPEEIVQNAVADFHIHPGYSIDAEGTLDEFCQAAFNMGLSEICFTTHYDADPQNFERDGVMVIGGRKEKLSDDTVRHYLNDITRVHEEYGKIGLMIRPGLEFSYFDGCEKVFADLQSKFQLYYRLGAAHNIDGLCINDKEDSGKLFARYTVDQMADLYFDQLDRLAGSRLVDCLAHLDIYRRFGIEYYGEKINEIHRGRIEKLFATMVANDVGYELNTSAIRHGHADYYPTMEIVNMARAAGARLISLGSDAHCPAQLGLDFNTAATIAYELFPYVDE